MVDFLSGLFFENPLINLVIITYVITAFFIPFGIYGFVKLMGWLRDIFRVKGGWIKVRRRHPSGRWFVEWYQPSGRKIIMKNEAGFEQDVVIKTGKGWLEHEGWSPFIVIDENLKQLKIGEDADSSDIPREHTTRMTYLSYLAGKIAGMREDTGFKILLIAIIIVVIGSTAFSYYMLSTDIKNMGGGGDIEGTLRTIQQKIDALDEKVNNLNNVPESYP